MAKVHDGLTRGGAPTPTQHWSVPSHIDLREWDGEFVVRCNMTSATYQLSPLAGEALRALQAGAVHAEDIVARVFDQDLPAPLGSTAALVSMFAGREADVARVQQVLNELEALGIARAHVG